jgi:chorismate mutase/prephenate dehydratase
VNDPLRKYRSRIDRVDRRLVRLLGKRYELVRIVGSVKNSRGLSIVQPERERQVLDRIAARVATGGTREYIRAVYRALFEASYRVEDGQ